MQVQLVASILALPSSFRDIDIYRRQSPTTPSATTSLPPLLTNVLIVSVESGCNDWVPACCPI
jgi:hypothetical protein